MTNETPTAESTDAAVTATAALAETGPAWYETGALGLLLDGGAFMWPLLILGILTLGVIIERWRSLKLLNTDSEDLRRTVVDQLSRDEVAEALSTTEAEQGPVAAVLANGLRKYLVLRRLDYDSGRIEEQVTKSMENYGVHIVAALERHLPILAIVASVAPMIGFTGTVLGMINSFGDIQAMEAGSNIVKAAAAGIEQALLTTCFGLIVGIPAFIAYNYFNSVINGFVLQVEETATELMEVVTLQVTLDQQERADLTKGTSA